MALQYIEWTLMTMFKLIDIRTVVALILVMWLNGEVYEFQMAFGANLHWRSVDLLSTGKGVPQFLYIEIGCSY